jgi:hypothetical protein
MVIYMKHPKHGNKVALCDAEAKADEKNGWERYQLGVLLTPVEVVPDVEYVESLEDLRGRWESKFGKKPHHKKSAETLRKELDHGDSTIPD